MTIRAFLCKKPRFFHGWRAAAAALLLIAIPHAGRAYTFKYPSWMWEEGDVGVWHKTRMAEFEAAHPGIKVQPTLIPSPSFENTIETQIAGGDVPDLLPVFTNMLAPLIDAGALAPLDDCIAHSSFKDRMLPSVSYARVNGKTYGVPLTMSPQSLLYNKKLLDQAGVGVPKTVDEMYAAAKAVKEKTGAWGYAFPNNVSSALFIYIQSMQWVIGFGSDWATPDRKITADAPKTVEAIGWVKRYLDEGLGPRGLDANQVRSLFAAGKVAFLFDGPWVMTQVQSSNPGLLPEIGFAVMPTPTHAAITGGAYYTIPAGSPHKADACAYLDIVNREVGAARVAAGAAADSRHHGAADARVPEGASLGRHDGGDRRQISERARLCAAGVRGAGGGVPADRRRSSRRHLFRQGQRAGRTGFGAEGAGALGGTTIALRTDGMRAAVRRRRRIDWLPPALLAPAGAIMTVLLAYPVLRGIVLSFFNTRLLRYNQGRFIGLGNYARLVSDPYFWNSVVVTLLYGFGATVCTYLIGLGLALLLNRRLPGRGLLRTIIVMPWAIPEVVAVLIFTWMLDAQYGVINYALVEAGILRAPAAWLSDAGLALPALIMVTSWEQFPLAMLILLAGLQTIPRELYEAAMSDGAGRWSCFRHITLPGLRAVNLILILMLVLNSFRRVTVIYAMTGGGPARATETLSILTYNTAFQYEQLGYAAAVGTALFIILLVLSVIYLRLSGIGREPA